ncbi:MAG: hypothetical protein ACRCTJ_01380 [Brevinema sp.]
MGLFYRYSTLTNGHRVRESTSHVVCSGANNEDVVIDYVIT